VDRVVTLTTSDEEQAGNPSLENWLSRPSEERLAEVERRLGLFVAMLLTFIPVPRGIFSQLRSEMVSA
jgi:hypothetical protein